MRFLAVGGAGYVGSHFVREAVDGGHQCFVYDSLELGHRKAVALGAGFFQGNIHDSAAISKIIDSFNPDAILHYAAYALVSESVAEPCKYYWNNVAGVISLIEALANSKNPKCPLVFSSSCAIFGTAKQLPMAEDDPKAPESPYGHSKLMAEVIIKDSAAAMGFPAMALRYFNACGAHRSGDIGEDHNPESHLIPNIIKAALDESGGDSKLVIYGDDFATKDGSCVRDYVHVSDLADAHILACKKLVSDSKSGEFTALNLGTGHGYSNFEVLAETEKVVGNKIAYSVGPRRAGDPAELFANSSKAMEKIGYQHKYSDLRTILETAIAWHRQNPLGFAGKD